MLSPAGPLHVRSGYSLLRGTAKLEELVRRARGLGWTHLALTDVNSLGGATRFWKLADEAGVQPLVGAELFDGRDAAVALIADDRGYENLCRLVTRRHSAASGTLPDDLAELSDGLELVVADGDLATRLLAGGLPRERLWLEVDPATQRHAEIRRLVECAERFGLPLTATGKTLVPGSDDLDAARLLAAIRTRTTFATVAAAELPHPLAVLRPAAQLRDQLADFPAAMTNNRRLAERCEGFRLLPRAAVFPDVSSPDGLTAAGYLRRLCEEGVVRRYGRETAAIRRRLDREMSLIERMGFSGYFLVVWDIVQYARRRGAPVAGRGSGASSLAAYLLGITNVCPLAYDLQRR